MKRRVNLLASALAAGAMVAGMVPAQANAAEASQKNPPAVVEEKKERRRRQEKKRGKTRRERIRELEGRYMQLSNDSFAELQDLRRREALANTKWGRRFTRRRIFGIGKTVRAIREGRSGARKVIGRGSHIREGRYTREEKALLLRSMGRPVSGRQWRKIRKAARRQERAA